jgi:hypothetical protein
MLPVCPIVIFLFAKLQYLRLLSFTVVYTIKAIECATPVRTSLFIVVWNSSTVSSRSDEGVAFLTAGGIGIAERPTISRFEPKQDLFRLCFGLFRKTKNKKFRFVSVFRTYIETTETNKKVSSKQTTTKIRFEPKQDLFRLCFVLFRKTKNKKFRFVSVFRTYFETTETNKTVSKQT